MTRNIRKTLQLLCLLCMVCIFIYIFFYHKYGISFDSCIKSKAAFNDIAAGRTYNSELIKSLTFNDEDLFYDSQSDFYLYSLISENSNAFNPKIVIESDYQNVTISFNEKSMTEQLIASNDAIEFIVYNDDYFYKSKLRCTTLPIISIDTTSDIPDSKYESTNMSFKMFDNSSGASQRAITSEGSIHIRGASSLIYPKKSYRLSLFYEAGGKEKKNKLALLGMRKDEDWLLYSIYDEPEKVRNIFSTNLWKYSAASDNFGNLDTGTEYKYVELFLNGEYAGLYALGYPMQASQVGITKNNPNSVMYRRLMDYGDTLMLESDGAPAAFRIQSGHERKSFSLLREYMIQLDKACLAMDASSGRSYSNGSNMLLSMIDIDNAADFFLFINLIQGWDNVYKNQNLALFKGSDAIKALYIPWDMDLTWGCGTDKAVYGNTVTPDTNIEFDYEAFYHLLQTQPESTISLLQQKYKEYRSDAWSDEQVLAMLDSYEKDIFSSGAYFREMERWPEGSYIDAASGDYSLSAFKSYVLKRLSAMDEYVNGLTANPDYEYTHLTFGSDVIHDCVSQLFSDENELVLLQINNPLVWTDEYYTDVMNNFSIPAEYTAGNISLKSQLLEQYFAFNNESIGDAVSETGSDTDLIAMFDNDVFSCCDNFFKGAIFDTDIGELIYYQADDGSCGLYLDGSELLTENVFERDFDIRVIHIDAESHEVTRVEEHKVYEK